MRPVAPEVVLTLRGARSSRIGSPAWGEGEVATEVQTVSHLRNDVDAAVVQGLPDAQIEIDFQAGLLLVKLVWQTDTQQVVRQLLDLALALFEERAEGVSLVGVSQS